MKYLILILTFLGFSVPDTFAANPKSDWREVQNMAFTRGEKLSYRAYYNSRLTGNMLAGEASLEIMPARMYLGTRQAMHIVGEARSRGLFSFFFKVENRYETYLDDQALVPHIFVRRVHEGSYRRHEHISFDQLRHTASTGDTTIVTVPWVQDIISAFYFARTLDFSQARAGDAFSVDFFFSDSTYVSQIVFDGREQIQTRLGTFNTLRFKPMVLEGSVFSQPYPMTLWISDDRNKIPVLIESGLVVGSVRLELVNVQGLRNSMTALTQGR